MQEKKIIKIEKEKVVRIVCDLCGQEIEKLESMEEECYEHGKIVLHMGFGSKYDGVHKTLDICDDCAKKHFDKFLK